MLSSKVCFITRGSQTSLTTCVIAPWELYTRARARRSPAGYEEDLESEEEEDEPDHIRQIRALARSELRFAELVRHCGS